MGERQNRHRFTQSTRCWDIQKGHFSVAKRTEVKGKETLIMMVSFHKGYWVVCVCVCSNLPLLRAREEEVNSKTRTWDRKSRECVGTEREKMNGWIGWLAVQAIDIGRKLKAKTGRRYLRIIVSSSLVPFHPKTTSRVVHLSFPSRPSTGFVFNFLFDTKTTIRAVQLSNVSSLLILLLVHVFVTSIVLRRILFHRRN